MLLDPTSELAPLPLDRLPRYFLTEGEIEILREAITRKIDLLECSTALEGEPFRELSLRESDQNPREAVVPFKNAVRNPPATLFAKKAIGQRRQIALRDHVAATASNSSDDTLS
jgi:hypothetical protein